MGLTSFSLRDIVAERIAGVHPAPPKIRRWLRPLLAGLGAGTFLYATGFRLVDSPLVCCPRLIVFSALDSRLLTHLLPLSVPIAALLAAVGSAVGPARAGGIARGVLFSTGTVGIALIFHAAGSLIDVKGGVPAEGAVLGSIGAATILAASLLGSRKSRVEDETRLNEGSLRFVGPVSILLGVGAFTLALLMPWTIRPFPLRLVNLSTGPYWNWSIVVPTAIVVPVIVAAVRMIPGLRQRQTEMGIALAGGTFATLLFVRVVGRVVSSSPPPFPPVFSLEIGVFVGLTGGALIVGGALFHARVLRH
jgi:energy-converting hydrogenase Eha subunit E